jgi:hypothetical protein
MPPALCTDVWFNYCSWGIEIPSFSNKSGLESNLSLSLPSCHLCCGYLVGIAKCLLQSSFYSPTIFPQHFF